MKQTIKRFLVITFQLIIHVTVFTQPKVLFLTGEGFNAGEFWQPYFSLASAGYQVDVASYTKDTIKAGTKDRSLDFYQQLLLEEVDVANYIALFIPGGHGPENLEKFPKAIEIVNYFMDKDLPVSAICHGPRLLAKAGQIDDRLITSWVEIKDELPQEWNSGQFGQYYDIPVVIDNNLITSRYPKDVDDFSKTLISQYAGLGYLAIPNTEPAILIIDAGMSRLQRWAFVESGLPNNGIKVKSVSLKDLSTTSLKPVDFDKILVVGKNTLNEANLLLVKNIAGENYHVICDIFYQDITRKTREIVAQAHEQTSRKKVKEEDTAKTFIVLRDKFDDEVFIQIKNYLSGEKIPFLVLSDKPGYVTGLNGFRVIASKSYNDLQESDTVSMVFLPGGYWTESAYDEKDNEEAAYIRWAFDKWKKGTKVVAFGNDPWRFCNRDDFKNKPVAASDMYRWKFGKTAKFVEDAWVKTDERLYTAKGASSVIRLLLEVVKP